MNEENKLKIKLRFDPIDFHEGLREQMEEFENLFRPQVNMVEKTVKKIKEDLGRRFCQVCFFGHVNGELFGEYICEECARELYGFDDGFDETKDYLFKCDSKRMNDLYYQLWYRKKKALPIFEAYLHAELERWKLESQFGWRSWKLDPPKFPDSEGFVFCGHQKYDYEKEMRYFVDVGHLDVDGTLRMFNDWDEGEQTFEIDYWFPLPAHPMAPNKEV